MFASRLKCRVIETRWATPSVFIVRFRPSKAFTYQPGQFVSVVVPTSSGAVKRCYSLASSPEESERHGHYADPEDYHREVDHSFHCSIS